MLNRKNRILIAVVSLLVFIVIIDCVIGFTLGGVFTFKHWLLVTLINSMFSFLSILFIEGKGFVKSSKMREPFVMITILLVMVSFFVMGGLSHLGASQEGIQYDTVIEECYTIGKLPRTTIQFYDQDGELQTVYSYKQVWFDDESVPEIGAKMTIKETKSAFGDTLYTIVKVNGRIQQ